MIKAKCIIYVMSLAQRDIFWVGHTPPFILTPLLYSPFPTFTLPLALPLNTARGSISSHSKSPAAKTLLVNFQVKSHLSWQLVCVIMIDAAKGTDVFIYKTVFVAQ